METVELLGTLIGVMFFIGILIGFIGAGGAGVMVSILTLSFGLSIHTAVGTALAAMLFTTISGAISHYREGNVVVIPAVIIGLGGLFGAILGADLSHTVPEDILQPAAGFALWLLAFLVWLRMRLAHLIRAHTDLATYSVDRRQGGAGFGVGILGGMASAFFGVGMAPFVQLGLMTVMRLPLIQAVGTTMAALVLISASGATALASQGSVSLTHAIGVTIGMTAGSYVGAKFTRRAPLRVLRFCVVAVPFVAGTMLIVS